MCKLCQSLSQHRQLCRGLPESSPLYIDGRVYLIKNGGIASCLDAATGELRYQERLDAGGPYYSSPVVGDGKIYAASARGIVTVYETGDTLRSWRATTRRNPSWPRPPYCKGACT